jgi:hypothetical protein
MATKLVAILSGGDWTDASVDHINIPSDCDLNKSLVEYNKWYRNIYVEIGGIEYLTFTDWLVKNKNAKYATSNEIETFEEI